MGRIHINENHENLKVYWINGLRSAGKSMFFERLREIRCEKIQVFYCYDNEYDSHGNVTVEVDSTTETLFFVWGCSYDLEFDESVDVTEIYLVRDYRTSIISMNDISVDIVDFIESLLHVKQLRNNQVETKHHPVHVVRYENLISDFDTIVKDLFLGWKDSHIFEKKVFTPFNEFINEKDVTDAVKNIARNGKKYYNNKFNESEVTLREFNEYFGYPKKLSMRAFYDVIQGNNNFIQILVI